MKPATALTRRNFWVISLNSTAAYVLAFLAVFYFNHFSKVVIASMFGIPISFDWNQIYFHIHDFQWTRDMVTTIFLGGPVLVFFAGIMAFGAFLSLKEEVSRLKSFFLWFALLSFNFFFGNLLIGNIFTRGVGYVFQWAYFSDTAKVVVAMIGFFGLVLTAAVIRRPLLFSANSYFSEVNERNFPFFFTAQVIVPFILGTFFSVIYFYPRILFMERYLWMSLGVVLLVAFLGIRQEEPVIFDPDEPPPPISVSKALVVSTVVLYVFLRVFLNSRHDFF